MPRNCCSLCVVRWLLFVVGVDAVVCSMMSVVGVVRSRGLLLLLDRFMLLLCVACRMSLRDDLCVLFAVVW